MADQIEERLREEIQAETPDILENLLQECGFEENAPFTEISGQEIQGRQEELYEQEKVKQNSSKVVNIRTAGRKRMFRLLGGTAAAVFLVAAGFLLYNSGLKHGAEREQIRYSAEKQAQENAEKAAQIEQAAFVKEEKVPAAVVSLDVNPSLEITIDDTDHVLTCTALNEDAEKILNGIDLEGSDIRVAAYAVIGAMLAKGYLNEDVNSVLVSVISADDKKGRLLEQTLSRELNNYLEDSAISAAVFGQYAGDDETVKQFAAAHHLSYGKAWLIRTLLSENQRLEEDSLLKLSTQELLLLWERQPEEEAEENRTVYGSVSINRYILPEAALQAALDYAGLTETDITDPSAEISCEDGIIIYEVEFCYGGREYEIDVNAENGEVIKSGIEPARLDERTEIIPETDDDPDDEDDFDEDDEDDYDIEDDYEDADDYDIEDIYEDADDEADDFYEIEADDEEELYDSDDGPEEDDENEHENDDEEDDED